MQCRVQIKCGATTVINSFDDFILNLFIFWYVQGHRVDFFVVACKLKYFFHYFIVTDSLSQSSNRKIQKLIFIFQFDKYFENSFRQKRFGRD